MKLVGGLGSSKAIGPRKITFENIKCLDSIHQILLLDQNIELTYLAYASTMGKTGDPRA